MQQKRGGEGSDPVEIPVRALETVLAAPSSAPGAICGPPEGTPRESRRPSSPTLLSQSEGERAKPGYQHVRPVVGNRSLITPEPQQTPNWKKYLWCQRTGVKEGGCRNLGLSPPQMPKSAAHPPPIVKKGTGSSDTGSSDTDSSDRVEMLTVVFLSNREANQRKKPNYLK